MSNGKNKKLVILICLVLLIFILDQYFGFSKFLGDTDHIMFLKGLKTDNIVLAGTIYVVLTIVGCVVLALPGAAFAVLAGLIFGPVIGTALCSLATTIGASGAFLAGRFFLRDSVKPKIEKNQYLNRLLFDESGENEILVLMVTRLIPLFPYNLQNFAYGITNIKFWPYTFYSFLFMLPGTAMFTMGTACLVGKEHRVICTAVTLGLVLFVFGFGYILRKKHLQEDIR